MKKYLIPLLFVVLATAWAIVTSVSWSGLNSFQRLLCYHGGLLDQHTLASVKELKVRDRSYAADIMLDSLGIPHIFSAEDEGMAYATGYMHARDRLFQMEVIAYTVMGRLAEIIGPEAVYSDENWKRFGFEEKAHRILDSLTISDPSLSAYLRAYAQGVNDYIAGETQTNRDPMFLVWGQSPQRWEASYSFLIQWFMSFNLTFYDDYVERQEMLEKLPSAIRKIIYPERSNKTPYIIPGDKTEPGEDKMEGSILPLLQGRGSQYAGLARYSSLGSNNWAVGKSKTLKGDLFLCNDLHLFLTAPNIFYELQLNSYGTHVYGFSIPGVPVVVTGHNEQVAWGITNGGWDVTELYLLKIDPRDKDHYWLNGKWETMTSSDYTIRVKGQSARNYTVRYTVFGPVVERDSLCYALRWYPSDWTNGLRSFWKLMHAADWGQFREALRGYDYPSQNFVYADVHGNIGVICAGKMPVKPKGYAGGLFDGTVFDQWKYIPFDSLPQSYDPQQDFLFSANQEPVVSGTYFGCRWFSDLYRPSRIKELLSAGRNFQWQDMQKMQLDLTDLSVKDLQNLLVTYTDTGSLTKEWKSLLNWDGRLEVADGRALFYSSFREAAWRCAKDLAGQLGVRYEPSFDQFVSFLSHNDSIGLGNRPISSKEWFHRVMRETDSLYTIRKGGSPFSFEIPQMTFLPGLDLAVNGIGGSDNTIDVNYQAHPVIRTLIRLNGSGIESWMVNATGQTGRINDAAYFQQFPSWERNDLHKSQFVRQPAALEGVIEHIQIIKDNQ